ncbi:hypothetical protein BDQ17DRAFT_1422823 [Cyathus striatus]|nr:hypothetical protein BDQ17DRAFT_1422823 [Cyathus striatus]
MATMLSHSSSSLLTDPSVPIVPQRRRREPEEIIDVDEFDDFPTAGSSSTARPVAPVPTRNAQPIILIDSDEDDEDVQVVRTSTAVRQQRPSIPRPSSFASASSSSMPRMRFFSPPPPPREVPVEVIPPVPQVPREYAALQGFTHRDRRLPFPVGPGATNRGSENSHTDSKLPYAIGASPPHHHHHPYPPQQRRESTEGDAPRAAPRSHHVPQMGLGGALITSNRARAEQERRRGLGGMFSNTLDLLALGLPMGPEDDLHPFEAILRYHNNEDGPRLYFPRERTERSRRSEEEEYQTRFTHPKPPEPGFTFDFAPREEEDSGADDGVAAPAKAEAKASRSLSTTLVCARCMDPLVLGAKLTEEESRRKIWALRCGHLIDEKCLDEIGVPPITFMDLLLDDSPKPDRKGKGKARAVDVEDEDPAMPGAFPDGGIRTRLRSRSSVNLSASSTGLPPAKKAKTKGKKKVKPGTVEDTCEWVCPVTGCGRVHVSALVDGVWGPKKDTKGEESRSAIAVFV